MMTMHELIAKCREGDPIIAAGEGYVVESQGTDASAVLCIEGADEDQGGDYTADDLRIRIVGDKLVLNYRNHGTTEWSEPIEFAEFEDLHTFVYEL